MTAADSANRTSNGLTSLIVFLLINLAISAAGGWITAGSVSSWYPGLNKPDFNPPDWVFAPVWTTLFVMIALAGWRAWRRRNAANIAPAMVAYALQLGLNLAWSALFFGLQRVDLAAIEVVIFLLVIVLNIVVFLRIDRIAGLLLVPYALWVGFAALLTVSIWQLN